MTKTQFSSDIPITEKPHDHFQRYEFSKRIATTILERKASECLVIGIYGAWGEGKTSVLNFIETELKNDDVISIKFNPWRFSDEQTLLMHFFNQIASALKGSIKTKWEKAGDKIKDYGQLLKLSVAGVGNAGGAVEGLGNLLSKVDLDEAKQRVSEIIVKSEKKIVIIVDDIDRLNKDEIHSLFRLVKLNADFRNTTYILAFDEVMVAEAIGERFGKKDSLTLGRNYIEKIIQLPLTLPAAQGSDLINFCVEQINKSVDINLSEDENRRYAVALTNYIGPRIKTPRLAVRYANALAFAVPILKGDVNTVDLLLIEALKIFYPKHYEFVKNNPTYFTQFYQDGTATHNGKIQDIKDHLNRLGEGFSDNEKSEVQAFLVYLFPILRHPFLNISTSGDVAEDWFKDQRISAARYFNRYFCYSIAKGDISDNTFEALVKTVEQKSVKEIQLELLKALKTCSPENLIFRLRTASDRFDWNSSKKIISALYLIKDDFPSVEDESMMFYQSPFSQVGIFINNLFYRHPKKREVLTFFKGLISDEKTIDLSCQVNSWVRRKNDDPTKVFTEKEQNEIDNLILTSLLKASVDSSLFEMFPKQIYFAIDVWKVRNKFELKKYLKSKITDTNVIALIKCLLPRYRSSGRPGIHYGDFELNNYKLLEEVSDIAHISRQISKRFSATSLKKNTVIWVHHGNQTQTDLNIALQFLHFQKSSSAK